MVNLPKDTNVLQRSDNRVVSYNFLLFSVHSFNVLRITILFYTIFCYNLINCSYIYILTQSKNKIMMHYFNNSYLKKKQIDLFLH